MSWWLYSARPTVGGMALIRTLGGKRIKVDGGRFRPRLRKKVINWGSSITPPNLSVRVLGQQVSLLNHADDVARCVNKQEFFNTVTDNDTRNFLPWWTESKAIAIEMMRNHKVKMVARTVLTGHSGAGIEITGKIDNLPDAKLYTQYIPKDEEYRIHLVSSKDRVYNIYSQKKVKRAGYEGKHNRLIRSYDNGYTYQHNNIEVPGKVIEASTLVFLKTGLDFGAVDVIYDKKNNRAYVLEINTAPGLEGHSVEVYAEAFKKYF